MTDNEMSDDRETLGQVVTSAIEDAIRGYFNDRDKSVFLRHYVICGELQVLEEADAAPQVFYATAEGQTPQVTLGVIRYMQMVAEVAVTPEIANFVGIWEGP